MIKKTYTAQQQVVIWSGIAANFLQMLSQLVLNRLPANLRVSSVWGNHWAPVPALKSLLASFELAPAAYWGLFTESNHSQQQERQYNNTTTTQHNIVHPAATKLTWSAPNNQSHIGTCLEYLQTIDEDLYLNSWSFPSTYLRIQWERNLNSWGFPSGYSRKC